MTQKHWIYLSSFDLLTLNKSFLSLACQAPYNLQSWFASLGFKRELLSFKNVDAVQDDINDECVHGLLKVDRNPLFFYIGNH